MDPSLNYIALRSPTQQGSQQGSGSRRRISPASRRSLRAKRNRLTVKRRLSQFEQSSKHYPGTESGDGVAAVISSDQSTVLTYYYELDSRYVLRSGDSFIPNHPSYESVARRRHLMESKGALSIPPVATSLCCLNLALFFFREHFNIHREEDIYVSWNNVIVEGEYWRLFVAQFFHFSRIQMLVNSATLFTIGRYLERKVTMFAMLVVILIMSAATQMTYILINPWVCKVARTEYTYGFGNVIYSLRVLLAYALEPRNYERDLVFGLYPMVVSASHAPWQPILDLMIFKIVLPEHCITGQLAGIVAGFLVTAGLLLWPTKGVYIAKPPYYWTLMGTSDPNSRDPDVDAGDEEEFWKIRTYTNSDFWLPTASAGMSEPVSRTNSSSTMGTLESVRREDNDGREHVSFETRLGNKPSAEQDWENSMQKRSDEMKQKVSDFFSNPGDSIVKIVKSITGSGTSTRKERNSNLWRDSDVFRVNKKENRKSTEILHMRHIESMSNYRHDSGLSNSSFESVGSLDEDQFPEMEQTRRDNMNPTAVDENSNAYNDYD